MRMRDILAAFGFNLYRADGRWYACQPGERPGWHTYSAGHWRDLIEKVVPPPPELLTPSSIKAWAWECIAACHSAEIDTEALARAAFAAYDAVPTDDEFKAFVNACKIDRRRVMEFLG